jgi:DNA-binding transcriptional regulator YiaG
MNELESDIRALRGQLDLTEKEFAARLSHHIRALRAQLGLTQEQFAARLSNYLTAETVSRWESGILKPSAYYTRRLHALQEGEEGVPNEIPPWGRVRRRVPRYPAREKRRGESRGEDWRPRRRRTK